MYLSLDPGVQKFGWVFMEGSLLLCSGISATSTIALFIENIEKSHWRYLDDFILEGKLEAVKDRKIEKVFLGNGTGKDVFIASLAEVFSELLIVDEKNSTLEARLVYWNLHPPRGWRKLIPLSLQTPPRAVDDLAAYCIALRGMQY